MESLFRDEIVQHLEFNGLINDSQHGFRKGRSCLTNLLTFLDKVSGYVVLIEKAITSPNWTGGKVYYQSGNV